MRAYYVQLVYVHLEENEIKLKLNQLDTHSETIASLSPDSYHIILLKS